MRRLTWLVLLLVVAGSSAGSAASKNNEHPDKEMLRMLDFLREMEMVKQVEMMQDLTHVEQSGTPPPDTSSRKPLPSKGKEAGK
jgi:hypothetical protein